MSKYCFAWIFGCIFQIFIFQNFKTRFAARTRTISRPFLVWWVLMCLSVCVYFFCGGHCCGCAQAHNINLAHNNSFAAVHSNVRPRKKVPKIRFADIWKHRESLSLAFVLTRKIATYFRNRIYCITIVMGPITSTSLATFLLSTRETWKTAQNRPLSRRITRRRIEKPKNLRFKGKKCCRKISKMWKISQKIQNGPRYPIETVNKIKCLTHYIYIFSNLLLEK